MELTGDNYDGWPEPPLGRAVEIVARINAVVEPGIEELRSIIKAAERESTIAMSDERRTAEALMQFRNRMRDVHAALHDAEVAAAQFY